MRNTSCTMIKKGRIAFGEYCFFKCFILSWFLLKLKIVILASTWDFQRLQSLK